MPHVQATDSESQEAVDNVLMVQGSEFGIPEGCGPRALATWRRGFCRKKSPVLAALQRFCSTRQIN